MQGSIKAGFIDLLVKSGEVLPTHQEQWLQGDGRREKVERASESLSLGHICWIKGHQINKQPLDW